MQGTPQQPDPSKPGLHIPVRIRMDPPVQVERPQREEDMPKGAYIKRRHFEKFGYTEDCEGCRRLRSRVMPRRPRLESCRKRLYKELPKTEEGCKLMEKANIKMDEYLAEKLEREGEQQKGGSCTNAGKE